MSLLLRVWSFSLITLIFGLALLGAFANPSHNVLQRIVLADASSNKWQFYSTNSTITAVTQNNSVLPSGSQIATFTLSVRFTRSDSAVYANYVFNQSQNIRASDELLTWLRFDSGPPSLRQDISYSYGLFLIDSMGNFKGLRHVPISWNGWNEIVLPTSFNPNDASSRWNESTSLMQVSVLRLLIQPERPTDQNIHQITFSTVSTLKASFNNSADLAGLVLTLLVIDGLFVFPVVAVIGKDIKITRNPIDSSLLQCLRPLTRKAGIIVFLTGLICKSVLILLTPLSSDYVALSYRFATAFPWGNVLRDFSIAEGGVWMIVLNFFYRGWLLSPVDHPTILEIFPGALGYPGYGFPPILYFLRTPGTMLFLIVTKSLLLFFDLGMGFLIYKLVNRRSANESVSLVAFAIWTLNPLTAMIGVLWGGVDLIVTFFLLLSISMIETRRLASGAVSYGISIGTKLFPIVLFPVMQLIAKRSVDDGVNGSKCRLSRLKGFRFFAIAVLALVLTILPSILFAQIRTPIVEAGQLPDVNFFYGPILDVFGFKIGLTIALYIALMFMLLFEKRLNNRDPIEMILVSILALFAFSRLNAQFLIWLLPFMLISTSVRRQRAIFFLFLMLISIIDIFTFGYYFAAWGNAIFFYPVTGTQLLRYSNILGSLPQNSSLSQFNLEVIFESVFAGFCLGYLYLLIADSETRTPIGQKVPADQF